MTVGSRRRFDTPPDVRVARKAEQQKGRIRVDQLRACGLDDAAVRRRVTNGWLHRVLDAGRQADLEAAGERVLRTTLEQAILKPHQLVRRLRAAGAPYTGAQP